MEKVEADASSGPEEVVQLNRNRSFKSKLLVRSQAIRESQSPPRTVSPSCRAEPPNESGTSPPPPPPLGAGDGGGGGKRGVGDWTEVRKSCSDSQVSGRVSDGDKPPIQQVEIQITSGAWDSERPAESAGRSVRSRHHWSADGRQHSENAALLSNNPRMMCVCGGCDRPSDERRRTAACPECRGKRRPHALCAAQQDSGIGCSQDCPDCADPPDLLAPPVGDPPEPSRTRRKTSSESADDERACRCLDMKARPKIGTLPRTDSEEKNELSVAELVAFVRKTLNQNVRDRAALLRIERELVALVNDNGRCVVRFPPVAAYGRMLVHRCAALFQLRHTVDQPNKNVVLVSKTGTSGGRIPCTSFRQWCTTTFPPTQHQHQDNTQAKFILKRDAHSLDEASANAAANSANMRSKSFEQREEEYERVRRRIFSTEDCQNRDEESTWPWLNAGPIKLLTPDAAGKHNRLLKVQSLEGQPGPASRGPVSKSHSFGGYGREEQQQPRILSRQGDLALSSWRLSPSSSGYKTLSLRSVDSVTPSPTGGVSPEPGGMPGEGGALVWAVTDLSSVPPGALIIHPQTGRPLTNPDGTVYHYDPARPPAVPCVDAPTLAQANTTDETETGAETQLGRLETQHSFTDPDCECQTEGYQQQNCCSCCESKTRVDWSYQCEHINVTAASVCPSGAQHPESQEFYPQTPQINEKVTSPMLIPQPESATTLSGPAETTNHILATTNHNLPATNHTFTPANRSVPPTNTVADDHQLQHSLPDQKHPEYKPANRIEDEPANVMRLEEYHQFSEYASPANSNMVHYPLQCYGVQGFRVEDEQHVHPQAVGSPGFGQDGQMPLTVQQKPYDAAARAQLSLGGLLYPSHVAPTGGYPYTNHCRMDQQQQPFYHQLAQEEHKTTPSPRPEPAACPLDPAYYPARPLVTPDMHGGVLLHNGAPYPSWAGGAAFARQMAPFGHGPGCAGACGVDPASGLSHCLGGQRSFGVTYGQAMEQPQLLHGAAYPLPSVMVPQAGGAPAAMQPYQLATSNQWPWPPLLSTVQSCPAPVQKPTTPPVFIQPDLQYLPNLPKLDYPSLYPVMFNNYGGYPQSYIPHLGYPLYHPVYQGEPQRRGGAQGCAKINAVKTKAGSGGNSSRTTPLNVGYATPVQQEQKSPIYPSVPYDTKFDNKETSSPTRTRLVKQSSFDQSQYDKRKPLRTNSARSMMDPAATQESSNSTELAAKIQQIKDHMSNLNVAAAEQAARHYAEERPKLDRNNSGSILGNYPVANAQFGGRIMGSSGPFIGDSSQLSSAAQAIVNSIRSRHCTNQPANFHQDSRNRYPGNLPHNQRTQPPAHQYRPNDTKFTPPNPRSDHNQPRNYRPEHHFRRPYQNYEGPERSENAKKLEERVPNPQERLQNLQETVPNLHENAQNVQEIVQNSQDSHDFQNRVPERMLQDKTHITESQHDRSRNTQEKVQNMQENVLSAQEKGHTNPDIQTPPENSTDNQRNCDSVQNQPHRSHNVVERSHNEQGRYQSQQERDHRRNQRFDGRSQDMRTDGQFLQRQRSLNQMVPYQFGRPYMFRQMSAGSWCRRSPGPVPPAGFNPRCGPRRPAPDTRRR